MKTDKHTDLCVIGAGSAGLSIAIGAAQLGVRVVLIERGRMGGECLNTGCIPSKSLLGAANAAHSVRNAKYFGIDATPVIDFKRVHAFVRSVIEAIAPVDSAENLENVGVEVIRGHARFADLRTILADDRAIRAHRVVIATGSEPVVPAIVGLKDTPHWTNNDIFDSDVLPSHLIIAGGGPIGVELGQAYCRLGSRITVIERDHVLAKDDPELVQFLLDRLAAEGVSILQCTQIKAVKVQSDFSVQLTVDQAGASKEIRGSHLLLAVGRRPRTDELGLQEVGIDYTERGIVVDEHLQTSVRGIYAAGDVIDGPRFSHVCSYHAAIVIKNVLLRIPAKLNYRSLPWVTYTDPELAQVGLTEEQARRQPRNPITVIRVPYSSNDRAQTERQSQGLLKLIADHRGRVLGASIVGAHAGESALLWVVAIERGLKLKDLAQMIAPYPTFGEINKTASWHFLRERLSRPLTRAAVRALSWLP